MHTSYLTLNIIIFIAGLAVLIKGCDWFIEGASFVARKFEVPEMIIGLTLVSVGTSLPELATDTYASFHNEGSIALGDIIGSNITNILLVLGVGIILLKEISIPKALLRRDGFIMTAGFIACTIMCVIGHTLGRIDGIILLVAVVVYLIYLWKHRDSLEAELEEEEKEKFKSIPPALIFTVIGLVMVFLGAKMLVDNVVWTANKLQLNQAIIAATIVAFGTSVPELAVTIGSVIKKKQGMALGNIVGSCIFNVCLILGICATISPIPVDRDMLVFNMPIMIATGILLLIFMRTKWKLVRWEGAVLLTLYCVFIGYNVYKIKG